MQKNKVFLMLTAVMLLAFSAALSAQSMDIVDKLLESEAADFKQAAYMVAVGSGIAGEDVTPADAAAMIIENKWCSSGKDTGTHVTLGEMSFMTMNAFDIQGGLMYMLFPSPRYAARELDYLEIIDGQPHPSRIISGEEVINILSKAMALKGAQ